jgi:drug/metabolite transporter (DMT)-like permease
MTHTQAYALLALVTVIWAGNFPLAKAGLAELSPVTLTGTRALLTAPALLAVVRAGYGPLPALRRRDYVTFVTLALAGLVGNTTIWYWGMRYTSPVNAGILGAAAPVLVALASAAWLHDPLSRRNVIGVGLTAVAVLLTVAHGSLAVLRTLSFNRGDIIILCSQLLWTTPAVFARGLVWGSACHHHVEREARRLLPSNLARPMTGR